MDILRSKMVSHRPGFYRRNHDFAIVKFTEYTKDSSTGTIKLRPCFPSLNSKLTEGNNPGLRFLCLPHLEAFGSFITYIPLLISQSFSSRIHKGRLYFTAHITFVSTVPKRNSLLFMHPKTPMKSVK